MKHLGTPLRLRPWRFAATVSAKLVVLSLVPALLVLAHSGKTVNATATPGTTLKSQTAGWYFRAGQWRADARTLVAAARWCFEPTPGHTPATNISAASGLSGLPVTNTAAVSRI